MSIDGPGKEPFAPEFDEQLLDLIASPVIDRLTFLGRDKGFEDVVISAALQKVVRAFQPPTTS